MNFFSILFLLFLQYIPEYGSWDIWTSWRIAICFTRGENEQFPMCVKFATRAAGEYSIKRIDNCSPPPQVKHVIFPNTSSDNCTFTIIFKTGKWLFSPRLGKITTVVESAIFSSHNRRWKYNFHYTCWEKSTFFTQWEVAERMPLF